MYVQYHNHYLACDCAAGPLQKNLIKFFFISLVYLCKRSSQVLFKQYLLDLKNLNFFVLKFTPKFYKSQIFTAIIAIREQNGIIQRQINYAKLLKRDFLNFSNQNFQILDILQSINCIYQLYYNWHQSFVRPSLLRSLPSHYLVAQFHIFAKIEQLQSSHLRTWHTCPLHDGASSAAPGSQDPEFIEGRIVSRWPPQSRASHQSPLLCALIYKINASNRWISQSSHQTKAGASQQYKKQFASAVEDLLHPSPDSSQTYNYTIISRLPLYLAFSQANRDLQSKRFPQAQPLELQGGQTTLAIRGLANITSFLRQQEGKDLPQALHCLRVDSQLVRSTSCCHCRGLHIAQAINLDFLQLAIDLKTPVKSMDKEIIIDFVSWKAHFMVLIYFQKSTESNYLVSHAGCFLLIENFGNLSGTFSKSMIKIRCSIFLGSQEATPLGRSKIFYTAANQRKDSRSQQVPLVYTGPVKYILASNNQIFLLYTSLS